MFLEFGWLYTSGLCCFCLLFSSNWTVLYLYRVVCCWSLIDNTPVDLSDETVVIGIARGCTVSTSGSVFVVFANVSISLAFEALLYLAVSVKYFILILSIF
jgi:hypothetical protein